MSESLAEKKDKYDEYYKEIHTAITSQLYGAWDSIRARAYWRSRLPDMDLSVLADVLTDTYSHTSDKWHQRRGGKEFL